MRIRVAAIACVFFLAVSCHAGNALPVGSLVSTFGTVHVSGVPVPSGATIFSGDVIETAGSRAVFIFREGDAVMVGANATVRVSKNGDVPSVEVLKGMSRVQLRSKDLRLMASNWTVRAKPNAQTGRAVADVLRDSDGVVSLNVQEGELIASNGTPKGVRVAAAGKPVLLPAAAVPPSAGAPAPQGSSGGTRGLTVGAYALAAAAIAVGAAAIAADDDTDQEARNAAAAARTQAEAAAAQAAAAAALANSLNAQITALRAQITALQAQVAALQAAAGQIGQAGPLLGQLASLSAQLGAQSAQAASLSAQIAAAAAAGNTGQLNALSAALQAVTNAISNIAAQLNDVAERIRRLLSP